MGDLDLVCRGCDGSGLLGLGLGAFLQRGQHARHFVKRRHHGLLVLELRLLPGGDGRLGVGADLAPFDDRPVSSAVSDQTCWKAESWGLTPPPKPLTVLCGKRTTSPSPVEWPTWIAAVPRLVRAPVSAAVMGDAAVAAG